MLSTNIDNYSHFSPNIKEITRCKFNNIKYLINNSSTSFHFIMKLKSTWEVKPAKNILRSRYLTPPLLQLIVPCFPFIAANTSYLANNRVMFLRIAELQLQLPCCFAVCQNKNPCVATEFHKDDNCTFFTNVLHKFSHQICKNRRKRLLKVQIMGVQPKSVGRSEVA